MLVAALGADHWKSYGGGEKNFELHEYGGISIEETTFEPRQAFLE